MSVELALEFIICYCEGYNCGLLREKGYPIPPEIQGKTINSDLSMLHEIRFIFAQKIRWLKL